jgi:hypothetical protein
MWLPHETIAVHTGPDKLCKRFGSTLYDYYSKPAMMDFWTKKRNYSAPNIFQNVAWHAINDAGKEIPLHELRWITKHATGICGVNTQLFKWKQRQDDKCPRCGLSETSTHVWQCKGLDSAQLWTKSLAALSVWMETVNTSPEIILTINKNLMNWVHGSVTSHPRSTLESAQDQIGWDSFIEGSISTAWASTQHSYYLSLNKKNSGQRWLTEIIKKLWKIAWDLWMYRNGIAMDINRKHLSDTLDSQIQLASQNANVDAISLQPHIYAKPIMDSLKHASIGTKRSWIATNFAHQEFYSKHKRRRFEVLEMKKNMLKFLSKK